MTAAMFVLYGDLSALNRTSRYGRKILPSPNSGSSSATSSSIGARTSCSYCSLWASQYVLVFSASSPSKNSSASTFQPLNAIVASSCVTSGRYCRGMAKLSASERNRLPDSAFAYVDATGHRRLPIHDEAHVRNALARFDRVAFEDDAARERARKRLLNAAKRFGIVPVGFITGQLRTERVKAATAVDISSLPTGLV